MTDGSAVLGLGNIGPRAALPVMEGKAVLFKQFGGVDAVPICLDTQDTDEIIAIVTALAPSFGGINLEDIAAPRCFEIERRLDEALPIPVFHDDQHGTAIVVLAALRNAAVLLQRKVADLRIVVSGAGAAGVAVTRMLLAGGAGDIVVVDSRGVLHTGREDLNPTKADAGRPDQPARRHRCHRRRPDRGGRPHRRLRRHDRGGGPGRHELRRRHLRPGQPRARGPPEHRRPLRRRGRDRAQRLPQPDQQRARLPRRVPGRARRRAPRPSPRR